jgi:nucleotide-binding universal stress UspA family protein
MTKIVVGVDGSASAALAARWACEEARRRHADIHLVHAWTYPYQGYRTSVSEPRQLMRLDAAELLDVETHALKERYCDVVIHAHLAEQTPTQALLDAAGDAELLVVGSRGRGGFAAALLGSVSRSVWHHSNCPVVVLRDGARIDSVRHRIVVEVDGSPGATDAMRWAINEARRRDARVLALATWNFPIVAFGGLDVPVFPFAEQAADALAYVTGAINVPGVSSDVDVDSEVVEGTPDHVLLARSAEADLVVLPARRAVGMVGSRVMAHASCPVVVIPDHEHD